MIINVNVANNVKRATVPTDDSVAINNFLSENGFDYSSGNILMNGSTLMPGDIYKTFADFGVNGLVYLSQIKKADNAKA